MASVADQLARIFARPIAHRGLHACGGNGPVENTIAAAEAAIAGGYGIECDVQLSRDGVAIVFHDETLKRLAGVAGRFDARDAADIAALHLADGSAIPTLTALLGAIAGRTSLVIEIKSAETGDMRPADAVLDIVRGYDGAYAIESFDPAVVAQCRDAACPIGLVGPNRGARADPPSLPRCDFLSWDIRHLATVARDHPYLPRSTWTVRTPADVDQAAICGAQIVFEGFRPS